VTAPRLCSHADEFTAPNALPVGDLQVLWLGTMRRDILLALLALARLWLFGSVALFFAGVWAQNALLALLGVGLYAAWIVAQVALGIFASTRDAGRQFASRSAVGDEDDDWVESSNGSGRAT